MATRTPSRTTSPRPPSESWFSTSRRSTRTFVTAPRRASAVTSSASSPKSISASVCASALSSSCRHPSSLERCAPPMLRSACFRCSSVSALMRSASPSTCVNSIRPFANAWRVNSPGSAMRRPSSRPSASSVAVTTAREPCVCSSTVSSPVNELGAGNHRARTSSIRPPRLPSSSSGAHSLRSTAFRGSGVSPFRPGAMRQKTSLACGPDTRTTDTPARPAPEESANMVSPTDEEGVKDLDTHASAAPASAALQCTATAARPSSDALGRSGSERQLRTRRVAPSITTGWFTACPNCCRHRV